MHETLLLRASIQGGNIEQSPGPRAGTGNLQRGAAAMLRIHSCVFAFLSVLIVTSSPASAGPIGSVAPDTARSGAWRSPLQAEWNRHAGLPWQVEPARAFRQPSSPAQSIDRGDLIVFGYLPYWTVGDVTLHLEILSHLAYMGADVESDGTVSDSRHWNTATMDEIIAAAHARGVKVVLTFINFDTTSLETLLNSPANRAEAIAGIVDLVVAGGGDGANLDFEGLPKTAKAGFVTFVRDLKDAMDAALGESSVTLAMPPIDWSESYDYDELAAACDGFFLMEYGYHYAGGSPGPADPLAASTTWGKYSVTWSLDDYDTYGGVSNRGKYILGMPLYGTDWPAIGTTPPSSAAADGKAVSYSECRQEEQSYGRRWDDDSRSPWYDYYDGTQYHQVWCDDAESLSLRMALARDRSIGGIGFWALGYENDLEGPWQAVVDTFELETDPVVADETPDLDGDEAVVVETGTSDESFGGDVSSDIRAADVVDVATADAVADATPSPDASRQEDASVQDTSGEGRADAVVADSSDKGGNWRDGGLDASDSGDMSVASGSGGCSAASDGSPAGVILLLALAALLFALSRHILCPRRGRL
jgi:spore germination protein YaaH